MKKTGFKKIDEGYFSNSETEDEIELAGHDKERTYDFYLTT